MVDMDSPQRVVTSFLTWNKIQDGVGRHFEKKENVHNSAAIWDIFTKFGMLVAMDSPQHPRMSFLGYSKIQDGGWLPSWKTENRNILAAVWAIVTKFGMMVDRTVRNVPWRHFWGVTKAKMAAGRHFEKRKMSITPSLFELSSPNLVYWS